MATISLYTYKGAPNVLNKALGDATNVEGYIQSDCDILRPTITIKTSLTTIPTYAYIEDLKRYYFVRNTDFVAINTYRMALEVDALTTHKESILASRITLTESDSGSKQLDSTRVIYDAIPRYIKTTFANTGLFDKVGSIIMITLKGKEV